MTFGPGRNRRLQVLLERARRAATPLLNATNLFAPIRAVIEIYREYRETLAVLGGGDGDGHHEDPHTPGRVAVFLFVLARYSRALALFVVFWTGTVFLFGTLDPDLAVLPGDALDTWVRVLVPIQACGALVMVVTCVCLSPNT